MGKTNIYELYKMRGETFAEYVERVANIEPLTKFQSIGLPDDAAKFAAEWYPELAHVADEINFYDIYFGQLYVYSDDELYEMLEYYDETEETFEEHYGWIIRDASFDGVLVCIFG